MERAMRPMARLFGSLRFGVGSPMIFAAVFVTLEGLWDRPVHAVLGGPQADVDTVAATLCLALHLNQTEQSEGVCVPVLWLWRAELPEDTLRLLHRLRLTENLLLWRDHLDLLSLQNRGALSLTVLREGLLDSPECRALKSSVRRVVHVRGQRDAEEDEALTTVAGEILQEAAEHVGAALGEALGEALRLQREILWLKHGRRSEQVDELLSYLEELGHSKQAKLPDWEQLLTKDAKEFSDGEMTIVLTSVTTDRETETERTKRDASKVPSPCS
uniref:Uncharacterized protein n=1 Tax=Neogobius melanostomus TaxID=47308 RepID=A0A8C6TW31_9GOBI